VENSLIKLLALDLDGTTLDSTGNIPDANREAIRSAEAMGVLVTIATGRRFRDAQPVGIDLQLNAPLITHNGALLKYADSEITVACDLLSEQTSREIVRVGKAFGGDALVSTDPYGHGALLYDRVSEHNVALKKYLRWSETLHGGEAGRDGVVHVHNLNDILHEHQIVHISFSGGCEAMGELEDTLKAELEDKVTLLSTIYPHFDFTLIDILPPDASKGHGVARLTAINDLKPENVMVVGDNFNDLQMLEFAGTPVVMGNAGPKLHAMGEFYTTLSNDEGGVAAAINRFILKQENN
jgi:Cof subfamily protein (haloacid dehalogenase superfamily)